MADEAKQRRPARGALSKEEQGQQTRERLLRAAVATMSEHGFGATSTTMIVKRLGITRGALNHHFADKDELIMAVGRHLLEERIGGIGVGIDPSMPVADKLRLYADSVVAVFLSGDMLVWIDILMTARRDRATMRRMRQFFNEMDASVYVGWERLFGRDCHDSATLIAARDVLSNFATGMAINRIFVPTERYWRDVLLFIEGMLVSRMTAPSPEGWPADPSWSRQFEELPQG